ncbi:MAG: PmoA family protein [Planctomycetaceae bacterium]|nr:PmoA family protein [Planctomycetaceae bacterium]
MASNSEKFCKQIVFLIVVLILSSVSLSAEDEGGAGIASRSLDLAVTVPLERTDEKCGQTVRFADGAFVKNDAEMKNFTGSLFSAPKSDGTVAADRMLLVASLPDSKNKTPVLQNLHLLKEVDSQNAKDAFAFRDAGKNTIALFEKDEPVYHYVYDLITNESVPKNEVRRRVRGCYMHPLFGLNGEKLTDDFPADHYHHHGMFWAWPHVKIGHAEHDFWNETTDLEQRFVKWLAKETGEHGAVLAVENGWFVGEKKVMIERVWFRSFKRHDGSRSLDVRLFFIPVDETIVLRGAEEKSYGGLCVRFKPEVAPENDPDWINATRITVPNGIAKDDLPDTPLEWADFTSRFDGRKTPSGAAIFVPPGHPDFPPTWLTRYYGPMCVGWPGVKDRAFEPQKPFSIEYRIWIHENEVDLKQLTGAYQSYCAANKN